jgi:hypothetical protein
VAVVEPHKKQKKKVSRNKERYGFFLHFDKVLITWHPPFAKVGTNVADKRQSLGR